MPSEVECVCCAANNSFFVKAGGRFVTLHMIFLLTIDIDLLHYL